MHLQRILRRRGVNHVFLFGVVLLLILDLLQILHCQSRLVAEDSYPRRTSKKVYIASIHWNNELILRDYWNDAVVKLTEALGRDNVFVTVYESGSWDATKNVLANLSATLDLHNIRHNITISDVSHADEISLADEQKGPGWIATPRDKKELRRIPWLSRLRNWTLQPLLELSRQGQKFDTILFLNDVVFSVREVFCNTKHHGN
jgi:hypothetical protein